MSRVMKPTSTAATLLLSLVSLGKVEVDYYPPTVTPRTPTLPVRKYPPLTYLLGIEGGERGVVVEAVKAHEREEVGGGG